MEPEAGRARRSARIQGARVGEAASMLSAAGSGSGASMNAKSSGSSGWAPTHATGKIVITVG